MGGSLKTFVFLIIEVLYSQKILFCSITNLLEMRRG